MARSFVARVTGPMMARRLIELDGRAYYFSPICYDLVFALAIRGERWTSYEHVIEIMWPNPDTQPLDAMRSVHQAISRLRQRGIEFDLWHGKGIRLARINRPHRKRYELNPPGWILGKKMPTGGSLPA